jgi:hypothetical protein
VSPARVGFGFFGTRRAHNPFTMQTLAQGVRSINGRLVSPNVGGGGLARHLDSPWSRRPDRQPSAHELRAAVRILDGGVVVPSPGRPLAPQPLSRGRPRRAAAAEPFAVRAIHDGLAPGRFSAAHGFPFGV